MPEMAEIADYVLTGGRIYTVHEDRPWAEAIAVRGSDIVYVGDEEGVKTFLGEGTSKEDLGGKFVMPGIVASHEHSLFLMAINSGLIRDKRADFIVLDRNPFEIPEDDIAEIKVLRTVLNGRPSTTVGSERCQSNTWPWS